MPMFGWVGTGTTAHQKKSTTIHASTSAIQVEAAELQADELADE